MTAPDHMFKNVKKATCINGSIHTCDGAYLVDCIFWHIVCDEDVEFYGSFGFGLFRILAS